MDKKFVTVSELSQYLSIPKATIYTWVSLRKIPGVVRLGRTLRFEIGEIDRWVRENQAPENQG